MIYWSDAAAGAELSHSVCSCRTGKITDKPVVAVASCILIDILYIFFKLKRSSFEVSLPLGQDILGKEVFNLKGSFLVQ